MNFLLFVFYIDTNGSSYKIKNNEELFLKINYSLPFLASGKYYLDIMTVNSGIKIFHNLENIFNNIENIKGRKAQLLQDSHQKAILSKKLATIDLDLESTISFNDLVKKPIEANILLEFWANQGFASYSSVSLINSLIEGE